MVQRSALMVGRAGDHAPFALALHIVQRERGHGPIGRRQEDAGAQPAAASEPRELTADADHLVIGMGGNDEAGGAEELIFRRDGTHGLARGWALS